MFEFDIWWKEQEEKLVEEGFTWKEQEAKDLALATYEAGFQKGQEE